MDRKIDPITMTVINNALETAAREMGVVMVNTAYSPIFNEGKDFSCALFDDIPEMIGFAEFVPAQLGAMPYTVEWTVSEIGKDNFHDGDVYLHNDPYRGGCHLPEYSTIAPVFYKGQLVGFVSTIGHMAETGGKVPAGFPGDAIEVFQEGLRLPPVKIIDRGKDVDDIWNIIMANVRTPRYSYGDVRAMIAACERGKTKFIEIVDKYGLDYFRKVIKELKNYAERRMRAEIAEIPNGRYKAEGYFADNDGIVDKPFKFKVEVIVEDGNMLVDYTGSDKQAQGPINCTYGVAQSGTWNAILHLTSSKDIPANIGRYRSIRTIVPPGSVLNVEYPNPSVGGNTETHAHIVDLVFKALKNALPDRVPAELGGSSIAVTYGGIHPDTGEPYTLYNSDSCGWGGRPWGDGNNCVNMYNGNCNTIPAEVLETRFPVVHEQFCLRKDSGGAGKYRGGLSMIKTFTVRAPEMRLSSFIEREIIAPQGIRGGKEGAKSAILVRLAGEKKWQTFKEAFGVVCSGKFSDITLKKGDSVKIPMPGGGGWGNPLKRDFALILRDVEEGFVSKKRAEKEYAVVFKKSKGALQIDEAKTAEIRKKLKKRSKRRS